MYYVSSQDQKMDHFLEFVPEQKQCLEKILAIC